MVLTVGQSEYFSIDHNSMFSQELHRFNTSLRWLIPQKCPIFQFCLFFIMIIKNLSCVFDYVGQRSQFTRRRSSSNPWATYRTRCDPCRILCQKCHRQRCASCCIKDMTCSGPVTLFDYHYTPLKSPNSCFLPCSDKNLLNFQSFTDKWVLVSRKKWGGFQHWG